jgi:predicted phosphodiesterase
MRVHIFSDLHLEFAPIELPEGVRTGQLAELVLLAGDIHVKRRGPAWAADTFSQPIAMIGGNHEAYADSLYASIAANRDSAKACSVRRSNPVHFLEREAWQAIAHDGTPYRVLGATLWTDFDVFGSSRRTEAMSLAARDSNDFSRIRILDQMYGEKRRLDPSDALRIHEQTRSFLEAELSKPFDGITIVMTHHAPSLKSIRSGFSGDLLAANYVSDLERLISEAQPDLWAHGHLHTSSDYRIGRTRVLCNPRGYHPFELNPEFDPELVVDL